MFNSNACVICGDSITDPVCRNCYIKQTGVLLNDQKVHSLANEVILSKIKNKFPIETLNDTECVLCRKDNVSLCRYCFSVILMRALRELNFSEDLIKNFQYNPMYEEFF